MATSPFKENVSRATRATSKRKASTFALSPVQKSAGVILQEMEQKPAEVEVRRLGVQALSKQSAEAVVNDRQSGYTICSWPKGKHTNEDYNTYLCQKDIFAIFFLLCRSSPHLCLADANFFLLRCLSHFLRRAIAEDLITKRAAVTDFLGPNLPFAYAWQIDYIDYVKWVNNLDGDLKINHGTVLRRAEYMLRDILTSMEYKFSNEQADFSEWIRGEALKFNEDERVERNVIAHFFTDLLVKETGCEFLPCYSEYPQAKIRILQDPVELGKKVLALDSLIAQADMYGPDKQFQIASFTLIQSFLERKVERGRKIMYGQSISYIPGRLPAIDPPLQI